MQSDQIVPDRGAPVKPDPGWAPRTAITGETANAPVLPPIRAGPTLDIRKQWGEEDFGVRADPLREVFASKGTAVNAWVSLDSRYLAEVLSYAGFDCVTVDLQHGMFGMQAAIGLLQAVSSGPAVPMARCPSLDPAIIGKLLDAGAYGLICPSIGSAEQAAAFVAACRYPPVGARSFGPARGLLYGGPDYVEHADDTILTWAMVESAAALSSLEEILSVPGLDGVYVGPNDLALSLGERPGQSPVPRPVHSALEQVVTAAHAAGRLAGAFAADGAAARGLADLGYDLVTPGNDVAMLRAAAAQSIGAIRRGRSDTPAEARSAGY
jgi:4-hydroxy-2-oxoheptanedioate aldolase